MAARRTKRVQPDLRRATERVGLLIQSELNEYDSRFQAAFASAQPSDLVTMLEAYCLARCDVTENYLRPIRNARRPEGIAVLEKVLDAQREKTLTFLEQALESRPDIAAEIVTRVALQLSARSLAYLAEARLMVYDAPRSAAIPKRPHVSATTIARRKRIVKSHRRERDMTVADLARKVGLSETTIRGVIQEDRSRFGDASQRDFLQALGVSIEEWYRQ